MTGRERMQKMLKFEPTDRPCHFESTFELGPAAFGRDFLKGELTDYEGDALDHFIEMLGVMAIQGELRHRTHYVFKDGTLYLHLESAYDSFRQHCKRIDYEGEVVDLKALKRMVRENHRQDGYISIESTRVYFGVNTNRRRACGLDLSKTKLVGADDFPQESETSDYAGSGWRGYSD